MCSESGETAQWQNPCLWMYQSLGLTNSTKAEGKTIVLIFMFSTSSNYVPVFGCMCLYTNFFNLLKLNVRMYKLKILYVSIFPLPQVNDQ